MLANIQAKHIRLLSGNRSGYNATEITWWENDNLYGKNGFLARCIFNNIVNFREAFVGMEWEKSKKENFININILMGSFSVITLMIFGYFIGKIMLHNSYKD